MAESVTDPGDARPSGVRSDVGVVMPAAGAGRRMGGRRKQYLALDGRPVLLRSLQPFLRRDDVREIVVALPKDDVRDPPAWLRGADDRIRTVAGGASRSESVRAGLQALTVEVEIVAIHDGARPLIDDDTLARCLAEARRGRGAVAGWPAVDTLKEVDGEGRVVRTPDRSFLWHAQTPQVFPRDLVVEAYEYEREADLDSGVTDDAGVVERAGGEVRMVRGSPRNIKITRPDDLVVAQALLRWEEEKNA